MSKVLSYKRTKLHPTMQTAEKLRKVVGDTGFPKFADEMIQNVKNNRERRKREMNFVQTSDGRMLVKKPKK